MIGIGSILDEVSAWRVGRSGPRSGTKRALPGWGGVVGLGGVVGKRTGGASATGGNAARVLAALWMTFGLLGGRGAARGAEAWADGTLEGIKQREGDAPSIDGDVMRGWRRFNEKGCVDCHAIWDQGAHVGPDLGRIRTGSLSGGELAGVMWNHIPKMRAWLRRAGRPPITLSTQDMADVFELMFFVRALEALGDPERGEAVVREKGCSACHAVRADGGGVGRDVTEWSQYTNPVHWAQIMWDHVPLMEGAMKQAGTNRPKLQDGDLVDIVAYVRSAGTSREKKYLRPGRAAIGQRLFVEKGCAGCHPGAGPDLAKVELPASMVALASRMWNHSPDVSRIMRERAATRESMTPQALADILAFVLALEHRAGPGDPDRGQRVFAEKGCAECHDRREPGGDVGPALDRLGGHATPVNMATAMWNHGGTMLERVAEAGRSWPVFTGDEMVDLLAYLRAVESD